MSSKRRRNNRDCSAYDATDLAPITRENLSDPPRLTLVAFKHTKADQLSKVDLTLEFGNGTPVCEPYVAYLEAQEYAIKNGKGLRSFRWFSDKSAGISRPPVVVTGDREKKAIHARAVYGKPPLQDSTVELALSLISMWKIPRGIDVNKDGIDDPIYFVARGQCNENEVGMRPSFWIRRYICEQVPDKRNARLMRIVAGDPSLKDEKPTADDEMFHGFSNNVFSFFIFEGRTYLDSSNTPSNMRGSLARASERVKARLRNITV